VFFVKKSRRLMSAALVLFLMLPRLKFLKWDRL
jgi:hypothetical protein